MILPVPPSPDTPSEQFTSTPLRSRRPVEEGIQADVDPDWMEDPEDTLVTVATFRFVHEAELAKLFLAGDKIQAFIMDAETVTMDWLLGNAIGNIKLQVATSQADRAEVLLEKFRPDPNAPPVPESGDFACLACGAEIPPDQSTCLACGWSYSDEGIQPAP